MSRLLDNDITTDQRPYIMELQGYLRTIQRHRDGSTTVPQDGFFGDGTTAGVQKFQAEEGLPQTGRADRATWDAIYVTYREIRRLQAPPQNIRGLRQEMLQAGDWGDEVAILQIMLRRLSKVYANIPAESAPGGIYTADTERAIRAIQQSAGLSQTGNTDKATWDAVAALYNRALAGGTA